MIDYNTLDTEFDAAFKTGAKSLIESLVEPDQYEAAIRHLAKRYDTLRPAKAARPSKYDGIICMKDFRDAEEKFKKLSQGFKDSMSMAEYIELSMWLRRTFGLTEVNILIGEDMYEPEVNGVRISSEELDRISYEFSMILRGNLVENAKTRTVYLELNVGAKSVTFKLRKSGMLEDY